MSVVGSIITQEIAAVAMHLYVLNGPLVGRTVRLDSERLRNQSFVIGRTPDCDLVLTDPENRLSRQHAQLSLRPDDQIIILKDLDSSNGTSLNGQRIVGVCPIFPGDIIGCGSIQMMFVVPQEGLTSYLPRTSREKPLPEDPIPGLARLEVEDTNPRELAIAVGGFVRISPTHPFTIGRYGDNDLQLKNGDISRYHAEIRWTARGYVIRDLGAANPLNIISEGQETVLRAPHLLRDGDRLKIVFKTSVTVITYRAPRLTYNIPATTDNHVVASEKAGVLRLDLPNRALTLGPKKILLPEDRSVSIGRLEDNDLILRDRSVSRQHARLVREAGRYIITDLGSSNGILINGREIKWPTALSHDDRVKIGDFQFIFDETPAENTLEGAVPLRADSPITLELSRQGTITDPQQPALGATAARALEQHPLRAITPFNSLDTASFEALLPYFKEVEYIKGQEIAREGQGRGAFFVVLSGALTLSRALNEGAGDRLVLAEIRANEFYGERTVFADQPFVNRLVVKERATVLRLEESDYVRDLQNNRQLDNFFRQQVATYSTALWLRGTVLMRTLSPRTITSLAGRMRYRSYAAGEILAEQNAASDEFFLIVGGQAEAVSRNERGTDQVIARLEEGDSYGDGIGAPGETYPIALRAATKVDCFVLTRADFESVLARSGDPVASLGVGLAGLPLGAVLNRISPFNTMPPQLVAQIAARMRPKNFRKGMRIFQQGEDANAFYIIRSGKVEISFQTSSGEQRSDETLGPGQFIGEAALSATPQHTATATAKEDCELLTLYRPDAQQVLQLGGEGSLGKYFAQGLNKRYRPKRLPATTLTEQTNAADETFYLLSNGEGFYKLSDRGYFLWQLMDGDNSINDLALAYFIEYKSLDIEAVANIVRQLQAGGYIEVPAVDENFVKSGQHKPLTGWGKVRRGLGRVLNWQTEIKNVDCFFTGLYNHFGKIFFQPIVARLLVGVMLVGFGAFIYNAFFGAISDSNGLDIVFKPPVNGLISNYWYVLILILLFNFFIHEIAHGLACKAFGRTVGGVGVGLVLFSPVFHVDTNEMWLEKRRPRIIVNLVGPGTNILIGGLFSLGLLLVPADMLSLRVLLFQAATLSYTIAYINLNPLMELDGYYALMDWVEIPGLRKKAIVHLGRRLRGQPDVRPYSKREIKVFRWFALSIPIYLFLIMVQFVFWFAQIAIGVLGGILHLDPGVALVIGWSIAGVLVLLLALPLFLELFATSRNNNNNL